MRFLHLAPFFQQSARVTLSKIMALFLFNSSILSTIFSLILKTNTIILHPLWKCPYYFYDPTYISKDLGLLRGNYTALDNIGLVVSNPVEEPKQAYSWLVLPDFSVLSILDTYNLQGITT
jgi:hypothetical protein